MHPLRFLIRLGILILLTVSAATSWAQRAQVKNEVTQCAVEMADLIHQDLGVRLAKIDQDVLAQTGAYVNYQVPVQEKSLYVFIACGERSLEDLDVKIYNSQGNLVLKDQKPGNRSVVQIAPKSSEIYIIKVLASKGKGAFAFASLVR